MEFETFADSFFYLGGQRLSNAGRPYLSKILHSLINDRRTVICSGRQCEKTSLLIKTICYFLVAKPPTTCLVVLPRQHQLYRLMDSRFMPMVRDSPVLSKVLVPKFKKSKRHIIFQNNSELLLDSAYRNPDAARGITARLVLADEFQDIATDALPILEECQSHQSDAHTVIAGTAKLSTNALERTYLDSTANVWMVTCPNCGRQTQAAEELIAGTGYRCPQCGEALDPRVGQWQELNPRSTFGASFRLPQLVVPWLNFAAIQEKHRLYNFAQFKNEVLGESIVEGALSLTLDSLHACCTDREPVDQWQKAPFQRDALRVMGCDWGNSGAATTAVCTGLLDENDVFHVLNFYRLPPGKSPDTMVNFVAEIFRATQPVAIALDDQGNGSVFRPLLFEKLQADVAAFGVNYTDQMDFTLKTETSHRALLYMNKTKAISGLVFRIHQKKITFPKRAAMQTYFVEIASERCIADEERRIVRYVKSPGTPDDALHALTYAFSAAVTMRYRRPFL